MRKIFLKMIAGAFAGMASVGLMHVPPAFAADQLTVASWGGAVQIARRKSAFEPFSKATGIKVVEDEYSGEVAKVQAMVKSKTMTWDVVDSYPDMVIQLCAEGSLERIDWKKLGLDRSKFKGADQYDCGVPSLVSTGIIAYDKDKLPNGPKSNADFFDLQKFPGKRGMYKNPAQQLERALMADGVPAKDVYKVLGTPEGVDRAFRKLDTIKKDIVWYGSGAQPVQLLADGQVVMTTAPNGRIYDAVKNSGKHFEIVWDAQIWDMGVWAIPTGSPNRDAAYKFIAFASSPQTMADLTHYLPYGPANNDALALVDPAILPHLPTAPANSKNTLQRGSAFWAEKGDELRQRFNVWLAK